MSKKASAKKPSNKAAKTPAKKTPSKKASKKDAKAKSAAVASSSSPAPLAEASTVIIPAAAGSPSKGAASTSGAARAAGHAEAADPNFQYALWLLLAVENWLLDFGRPFAMSYVPTEWFPLYLPSLGDYFHMIYNVVTPFIMLKLLDKSSKKVNRDVQMLLVIFFVMGASMHLVGDSCNHRLIHLGYNNNQTVRENDIFRNLNPKGLMNTLELLYFYDEKMGHLMWYIAFFAVLVIYFYGSFVPTTNVVAQTMPATALYILMPFSGMYFWYLSTEGQISELFLITTLAMAAIAYLRAAEGLSMDSNGRFLLYTFTTACVLVAVWVAYYWSDAALNARYPIVLPFKFLYVPEPWTVKALYWSDHVAH